MPDQTDEETRHEELLYTLSLVAAAVSLHRMSPLDTFNYEELLARAQVFYELTGNRKSNG